MLTCVLTPRHFFPALCVGWPHSCSQRTPQAEGIQVLLSEVTDSPRTVNATRIWAGHQQHLLRFLSLRSLYHGFIPTELYQVKEDNVPQRATCCVIPFIQFSGKVQSLRTENRPLVAKGWGGVRDDYRGAPGYLLGWQRCCLSPWWWRLQDNAFVKVHRTMHLKRASFTICKLYLKNLSVMLLRMFAYYLLFQESLILPWGCRHLVLKLEQGRSDVVWIRV